MAGEDWKAEARRLLAEAVGNNDNRKSESSPPRPQAGMHFYGPVTMVNVIDDEFAPAAQRRVLQARLQGWLMAEGATVAATFAEEVGRSYGVRTLGELTDAQLADLLGHFDRLIRVARMLAVTPKR